LYNLEGKPDPDPDPDPNPNPDVLVYIPAVKIESLVLNFVYSIC